VFFLTDVVYIMQNSVLPIFLHLPWSYQVVLYNYAFFSCSPPRYTLPRTCADILLPRAVFAAAYRRGRQLAFGGSLAVDVLGLKRKEEEKWNGYRECAV